MCFQGWFLTSTFDADLTNQVRPAPKHTDNTTKQLASAHHSWCYCGSAHKQREITHVTLPMDTSIEAGG
jgi:hypothetical protein